MHTLWLSLGENCLSDDVLKRHGLRSFATPYSAGRSNIDHALALEALDYAPLQDPSLLVRGSAFGTPVVRIPSVRHQHAMYDPGSLHGFELTQHDPLQSADDRASIARKVQRLLQARGQHDVVFLYHHRRNPGSDLPLLRRRLEAFAVRYEGPAARCHVVLFHQEIEADGRERRVDFAITDRHVLEFTHHTAAPWGGLDADQFYARHDDDLIARMLQQVSHHLGLPQPAAEPLGEPA